MSNKIARPAQSSEKDKISQKLSQFCEKHQLPASYAAMASTYFLPLVDELASMATSPSKPLIGINGCQGSGKSTLADLLTTFLQEDHKLSVANLSIDDFYHTHAKRQQLAEEVHPLFATRGVPGTHDTHLLQQSLEQLVGGSGWVSIPRFDKAYDDRRPVSEWDRFLAPADLVILEGWCVGANVQQDSELLTPVNELEANEDRKAIWRSTVNQVLRREYQPLFQSIDLLIMLQAPSFDCVYHWRKIQEDKLRQSVDKHNQGLMDEGQLKRFIQHYQRLTEHMLRALPTTADVVFTLNRDHRVTGRKNNER